VTTSRFTHQCEMVQESLVGHRAAHYPTPEITAEPEQPKRGWIARKNEDYARTQKEIARRKADVAGAK
jgi:hypothetical protein